ncbi:MAG: hypothetical protein QM796_13370 [Chthoniobacteraceae bacterium]
MLGSPRCCGSPWYTGSPERYLRMKGAAEKIAQGNFEPPLISQRGDRLPIT